LLDELYKKVKYAVLCVKAGGLPFLLAEIKRRSYSREILIGLEKYLSEDDSETSCPVEYSLRLASPEDIEEAFQDISNERQTELFDLIQRKWFYESGFNSCYIAREAKSGKICYMEWIITRRDNNSRSRMFSRSFPWVGSSDVQFEHSYTFTRYRGKRIMPSVTNELCRLAHRNGFRRAVTYVLADNISSLKGFYAAGFRISEEIRRTKVLSLTWYTRKRKRNDSRAVQETFSVIESILDTGISLNTKYGE
jgi:RimJ/RimL family protein N-acetyltransferase